MQGRLVRARRMTAWLGCASVLVLGLSGSARAESPPCDCSTSNQSVVSEVPCLTVRTAVSCGQSTVRNACEQTVTLVDWPLWNCPDGRCTQELPSGEEVGFIFARKDREEVRFVEQSYTVRVDGADQQLAVSAEVTCSGVRDSGGDGCAAASGALGAAGVALLMGAVARRRRGALARAVALAPFRR
ncbi:MXAN_0125 family MYXO-CTERM protein [Myxococcus vastator]|uniref:MXAN_0125 family MYXO-CTERM protein n=1 Tax=Myxococcus vastator TaxID=2709664 RepID=UPI001F08750F|nr:MXAN_0125 family MYXO-CTERM protein [Myxococcus vastator]